MRRIALLPAAVAERLRLLTVYGLIEHRQTLVIFLNAGLLTVSNSRVAPANGTSSPTLRVRRRVQSRRLPAEWLLRRDRFSAFRMSRAGDEVLSLQHSAA